ncbi:MULTISPECIES: RNA polymerase sigma factor [unclassified Curtobacterium]|uniref:RNA polymerase sigma factor n=1 Tax=unclassified Curtobacterium TaxID=257496 RepID=UPI0008268757|nr:MULTISPECIES: sigma-70 family RNA polymerase sigma factor [unclassified Curtobacterium]WIA95935.1 sigma-70 family RNA polymerase sigma factor [Curtobacterium sp. MCBA15_004]WIA99236.1 sigma-70 family RNA polymerase sigma factor [Curtobacterium sp. MCBA15_012]
MPHQSLVDLDDAVLAGRSSDGDVRAFEVLIRRYTPLLRAYARRTLGSTDELDDVVQETFITAWGRLDALEDGAKVKSWLMRILSRKCIDRIRARRDHDDVTELEVAAPRDDAPDRVAEARSREEALETALAELPEQQRRCWLMKEVLEYRYEDIAEELDLPVSTVRGLLSRARKNMIRLMEAWR